MTHTPAEWAEMVALAFGIWGTCSALYFLLVDADLADFDPRPALETGRLAPAWQIAVHAGHDFNRTIRSLAHASAEAYRDAAALLLMLTTIPTGDLR